jgi:pimeloyl-ACP methyl ester carboxylesterase
MSHPVHFFKKGAGPAVILLHGFPMNSLVWEDFVDGLSESYTVYTPDLPGLGKSPVLPEGFTLQDVAVVLNEWVATHNLQEATLIGHSLGGYVALAMVAATLKEGWFSGLGLFHSTAYADSEEKKQSRTKVLTFIDDNGVDAFTSNFIQPLFVDPVHPAIPRVRQISMQAGAEGVKGYTVAMRDRSDMSWVLKEFKHKVLLIAGEHDKAIPVASLHEQAKFNPGSTLCVLQKAAHMGMFEEREKALEAIKTFLVKNQTNPSRR